MRFPPAFLDDIRARIPISDVVGRKVTWDKRKSNPGRGDYWACCPFHGEKTPSFHAENRVLLHPNCHAQVHSQGLTVVKPRPPSGVRKA